MTAEELADMFEINISAARIRLEEIERMRRRRLGLRRELPPSIREFLENAKKAGHPVTILDD